MQISEVILLRFKHYKWCMQATREIGLDARWEALPPPVALIGDVIVLAERFGCSPAEAFFTGIMDLTEIHAKGAQGRIAHCLLGLQSLVHAVGYMGLCSASDNEKG